MATTNYQTGTVVSSLWLNDVDYTVYTALPFAGDAAISAAGSVLVSNGTGYEQQSSAAFLATINMEIGTDVQAWDTHLDDIAALTTADGAFIVGDGTNWVAESGATARTSLGLAIGTDVQAWDDDLDDIAALTPTDGNIIVGDGTNWVAESGATARTSLGLGTGDNVTFTTINGTAITGSGAVTGDTVVGTNGVTSNGNDVLEEGIQTISIPAGAFGTATTNGAEALQYETTTNAVNYIVYAFDASTDEYIFIPVRMPKSWDEGTITAAFTWTSQSGSGTVEWGIQGVAFADSDALDTAFGTAQTVNDTLLTAEDAHISGATGAVTIAGSPAAEELVMFRVFRDTSEDTLAVDAELIAVTIYYNVDAPNDD